MTNENEKNITDTVEEKRQDISWYECIYEISNLWRIRSYLKRWRKKELLNKPTILNPRKKWKDNMCITLTNTIWKKHFSIARLVAQAYMNIDYKKSKKRVVHISWDYKDNSISNISIDYWCKRVDINLCKSE